LNFELSIEISEQYDFNRKSLGSIEQNTWVKNQWPLVYFIQNQDERIAYVGESTNFSSRIKDHLSNPKRARLNKISIIGSDKFNKSATLDIESNLIQYITAEGTYELQNGNYGLINHQYYQQDLYKNLFKEIWQKLIDKKVVTKSLLEIENSELFKYSPYKSLNEDQYNSVLDILKGLTTNKSNKIFVSGSAGTGKTILATYLIKLLATEVDDTPIEEMNEDEIREINYIKEFRKKYKDPKIGLVIAMTSLRESLENVFRKIPGLKSTMVISPSDTFKLKEKYDLLIIDEAHRLRQYRNISWMGAFKKNNEKLKLGNDGNELDWILANSKNQIFFYDSAQSVKPSDIDSSVFTKLLNSNKENILKLELKSQMRVKGGNNYIQFVDDLMNAKRIEKSVYSEEKYDLLYFDSMVDLSKEFSKKEEQFGLCRLVAGYSWPWLSDVRKSPKPDPNVFDIELDGLKFKWNSTMEDWINTPNAFSEVGCIHTVQGYDLNYVGVIFGKEIDYNTQTNQIEINSKEYLDINGKKGINDPKLLKSYIINIYKTILYRGIKGAYVYACNPGMREYLKRHLALFKNESSIAQLKKEIPFRKLSLKDAKPYVNSIPFLDIYAAAGNFSDLQNVNELTWVEPPFNISVKKGYFICQVKGESMNKVIPNASYCLFRQDDGGTREGKIVLVQSTNIQDSDFGSGYTVKKYHSVKEVDEHQWKHNEIILNPYTDKEGFPEIKLKGDELLNFKVIGIFDRVIEL
jgi:DUF2075 family protein/DNA replication protein DnaC